MFLLASLLFGEGGRGQGQGQGQGQVIEDLADPQSNPAREATAPTRRRRLDLRQTTITIDPRVKVAIKKGLDYLARNQNQNGSWSDVVGRKIHNSYDGWFEDHVGVTALAGIAFLASGSLPDQGPYQAQILSALEYILEQIHPTGYVSAHGSRMYEHAFATLFLAEACGMTRDDRVEKMLKKAVRLIVKAQNDEGGWRYLPDARDSDMSVTVCQVLALRAARNAGVNVPRSTVDNAIRYVKKSFRQDKGAFDYQIPQSAIRQSRISFALTAAGVTTLYGAGEYDAREIRRGLDYLWSNPPDAGIAENRFDYYYGQYYAIQAMFQAGGSFWSTWYRSISSDLIRLQRANGSWVDLVGPNYATSMATIILLMPYQYLPITER